MESEGAALRPGGNLGSLTESEPDYFGLTLQSAQKPAVGNEPTCVCVCVRVFLRILSQGDLSINLIIQASSGRACVHASMC